MAAGALTRSAMSSLASSTRLLVCGVIDSRPKVNLKGLDRGLSLQTQRRVTISRDIGGRKVVVRADDPGAILRPHVFGS